MLLSRARLGLDLLAQMVEGKRFTTEDVKERFGPRLISGGGHSADTTGLLNDQTLLFPFPLLT